MTNPLTVAGLLRLAAWTAIVAGAIEAGWIVAKRGDGWAALAALGEPWLAATFSFAAAAALTLLAAIENRLRTMPDGTVNFGATAVRPAPAPGSTTEGAASRPSWAAPAKNYDTPVRLRLDPAP